MMRRSSGLFPISQSVGISSVPLDTGRGNIVAWFDISDVFLDEVGDGNIVGQRDGHGLALARLDR
jgi:hypothetical protein